MEQKKDNVLLKIDDHRLGITCDKSCGTMSSEDMKLLYSQICKEEKGPAIGCLTGLSAELKKCTCNNFLLLTKESEKQLTITMHIAREWTQCRARNSEYCLKNLISGECKDKFVVNLLAKKLFADKYQNNER